MRRIALLLLLPFLSVIAVPPTAAAETWVVDDDGGADVDFLDIPPAITAAAAGDRILVRGGNYTKFVIDKGLKLVFDKRHPPALPIPTVIGKPCEINDLTTDEIVVISGFSLRELYIRNCQGTVMLDGCDFGQDGYYYTDRSVLHLKNCEMVQVSRCLIQGARHGTPGIEGAARLINSTAVFSECTILGGTGIENGGSPAVRADDSDLFCFASMVKGAKGGVYIDWDDEPWGMPGAPAFHLIRSRLELFSLDLPSLVIQGGDNGMDYAPPPNDPGPAAPAILIDPAGKVFYSGIRFETFDNKPFIEIKSQGLAKEISPEVPVMRLEGTGELGTSIAPTLHGLVDSAYAIYYAKKPAYRNIGSIHAQLLLELDQLGFMEMGIIPSEGFITTDLNIPYNPLHLGKSLYFQAYVETPADGGYLSTSAGFVVQ